MKFAVGCLVGVILGWSLAAFMWSPMLGRWIAAYEAVSDRQDYFFSGANKRSLLDICDRDGKQGVYYREDCDKTP